MAANPDLLTKLRDFLVTAGVVRDPRVAGPKPPFWRHPRDGAIAPGEKSGTEADAGVVVSAFLTDEVAGPILDQPHFRRDVVTMRIRSTGPKGALDFEWGMRAAMLGNAGLVRSNFDLAGLTVIEVELWRGLGFIGSDEQGFDYSTGYVFTLYS